MKPVEMLDALTELCSEESGCPALQGARERLMGGDWCMALRYLKQVGPCGQTPATCRIAGADLYKALLDEEKARLRQLWNAGFGDKPLEIDFVCRSPLKLSVLRHAMESIDLIPLSFSLVESAERADVIRFVVEL